LIENAANTGQVLAAYISPEEYFIASFSLRITLGINALHQHDPVFRKRSGLVGTKNIHAAEVMDRRQFLYDDAVLRHLERTFRKVARYDKRQKLRRKPDRDRYRKQKYLEKIAVEKE